MAPVFEIHGFTPAEPEEGEEVLSASALNAIGRVLREHGLTLRRITPIQVNPDGTRTKGGRRAYLELRPLSDRPVGGGSVPHQNADS